MCGNILTSGLTHLGGDIYVNLKTLITKHARIHEGEDRSGALDPEKVAVKILPVNTIEDAKPLIDEARVIRNHPHPNVVRYIDADFNSDKFMCMYLVMEMCREENLHDHVIEMRKRGRKFSFEDCMSVARQLSSALKHLHERGILHRDIKPSNVLFSLDGHVLKLSDFSLVKPLRPDRSATADSSKRIGTDGWRAREVYLRNSHGKKSDVYSLGLLLYYVWSNGEQAFGSDPDLNNFNIKHNRNRNLSKLSFDDPDGDAISLLEMMLRFDQEMRISSEEVASCTLCKNADREIGNPEGILIRSRAADDALQTLEGSCFVILDRITAKMNAFQPSRRKWGSMQMLSPEMITWNMSIISVGEYIYALLENRRMFRIKYTDPNSIWENQDDMLLDHGAVPNSALLEGYIYVIGGSQWKTKISKAGECFDAENLTWSRIPDMLTGRKVHCVVACKGCVYSIGGRDDTVRGASGDPEGADVRGEKYDPATREWSHIAKMNKARHAASATAMEDKIYILGGWRGGISLNEAESYDTRTNVWTVIRSMEFPRSYLSSVSVGGKVYAINGDNHSSSPLGIEEYDPLEDKWQVVATREDLNVWECASASINITSVQ